MPEQFSCDRCSSRTSPSHLPCYILPNSSTSRPLNSPSALFAPTEPLQCTLPAPSPLSIPARPSSSPVRLLSPTYT
ncbi:hypothetical protein C8R44DRAFT_804882 [Mycena epipterygia]|nr:hypothetical protein C8R44DRAFT_804882 [Mycena epipterygia]